MSNVKTNTRLQAAILCHLQLIYWPLKFRESSQNNSVVSAKTGFHG
jgi:hypothetical protein